MERTDMELFPRLPPWQQWLLLACTLVAVVTLASMLRAGTMFRHAVLPLLLPVLLCWPPPAVPERRLMRAVAVGLALLVVMVLLYQHQSL